MERWLTVRAVVASVLAALVCAGPGAALAKKHPLTFEDTLAVKSISGVTIAPDGLNAAFVTSWRDLAANGPLSAVQVVDLKTEAVTAVTAGGRHEGDAAWAPDSKRLAFVSDAGGTAQIYVKDMAAGTEPAVVTKLTALGPGSVQWTPDGQYLVFVASTYPDCRDEACVTARDAEKEKNPVKARLITALMYRHWNAWDDGKVKHLFVVPVAGGAAVDQMPGNTWGLVDDRYAVDPEGKWLAYTSKNPQGEATSTNTDLYSVSVTTVPLETSQPLPLASSLAADLSPVVSPDGRFLIYQAQARPGFESDRFRLASHPVQEDSKPLFPSDPVDSWVQEFGWFPDSKDVWFAVPEAGRTAVYTTDFAGRAEPKKVLSGAYLTEIHLTPDGKDFVCVKQSLTAAPEIWRYAVGGKRGDQLTKVNAGALADVELAKVEEVWWDAADGVKVHGFVLFPPGTSKERKNPMVMLVHGGPQGMWEDMMHPRWNPQLFAAPGYVVFLPNPRGSSGYGQKFVEEVSRDWGGKAYTDLMAGVDFLIGKGWVDPKRMAAGGGSFGGYMANWIEGSTDRFACLISHAGVYDLTSMYGTTEELWFPEWEYGGPPWESEDYQKWSPSRLAKNFKTPMLVIHGAGDFRVPESQAMQLFTALQRQGVPSKFLYFPDETHFVSKPLNSKLWWETVQAWLGEWIGKK